VVQQSRASASECLDENEATAFVGGLSDPADAARIEVHLDQCPECFQLVSELARVSERASPHPQVGADPSPLDAPPGAKEPLRRGTKLGRYVLLKRVGGGAVGVVYAAYDPKLDRQVALKLLRAEGAAGGASARLLREGRAMAKLTHANVVTVHDVGVVNDRTFLAMEFVDGATLRDWSSERVRRWRETLDVFVRAGRGLAAAHHSGIVHRDFKPANVLIDRAGRVLVTDFGFARSVDAEEADVVSPDKEPDHLASATVTAGVVGTPAYMAPEQHRGETADARSDQFAFSVALYEALYGERPFAGDSVAELRATVSAGTVRPAPNDSKVPPWLRRVLLRGLRVDPNERFASMDQLLAVLSRHRNANRWWIAAVLAVIATAGAVALGAHPSSRPTLVCKGAERKLDGLWDEARKKAVHDAFLATGKPYAQATWERTEAALDGYAKDWVAAHTDACEATRVRGEQSNEMLDLRMACLDEVLSEMRALTRTFASADADVLENAVAAADSMTPLARCKNTKALTSVVRPPADDATATKIKELRSELAEFEALRRAGQWRLVIDRAAAAVRAADDLGYRPVQAEALYQYGELQELAGDMKGAIATYYRAAWAADEGRDDEMRARAWVALVFPLGVPARNPEPVSIANAQAVAALARAGGNERLEVQRHYYLGAVLAEQRKYDEAGVELKAALAQGKTVYGEDSREVGVYLEGLAIWSEERADYATATEASERALAIFQAKLGREHPNVAIALTNTAKLAQRQRQYDRALDLDRRAIAILEASLGPEHPTLAIALTDLGRTLTARGEYREALASHERALSIQEKRYGPDEPPDCDPLLGMANAYLGLNDVAKAIETLERALRVQGDAADPLERAGVQFSLARAVWARDRRRAGDLATAAADAYAKLSPARDDELAEVRAWLDAHPRR
jgi:tetratricopeptide (TPR) repeat protein